jgi:hypothetical protein
VASADQILNGGSIAEGVGARETSGKDEGGGSGGGGEKRDGRDVGEDAGVAGAAF